MMLAHSSNSGLKCIPLFVFATTCQKRKNNQYLFIFKHLILFIVKKNIETNHSGNNETLGLLGFYSDFYND